MRVLLFCTALFCSYTQAAPWEFGSTIPVTQQSKPGVFVHLESAGRKNIAVLDGWVAVAWEDNRDGTPRCYVALKAPDQTAFGDAQQISGQYEAAEPAIVSVGAGRFALAWEEDGRVWARTITVILPGHSIHLAAPLALSAIAGAQASLSFAPHTGLFAAWSERGKGFWQIKSAQLRLAVNGGIHLSRQLTVDKSAGGDQSYPSITALSRGRTMIAWEDRRAGHTRLFYAVSENGRAYSVPQKLNESVRHGANPGFGQGTGVMRVALAAYGRNGVVAVWADKRDFQSGYDVYGGFALGPKLTFAANEKVQDEFGDNFAQWHPAIAANMGGRAAAVWDDNRDGTPDVWLSWRNANGWSGDLAVPGASGPGVQSDPSITMDEAGNLHLVWVEKSDLNGPSSIRYIFGRLTEQK